MLADAQELFDAGINTIERALSEPDLIERRRRYGFGGANFIPVELVVRAQSYELRRHGRAWIGNEGQAVLPLVHALEMLFNVCNPSGYTLNDEARLLACVDYIAMAAAATYSTHRNPNGVPEWEGYITRVFEQAVAGQLPEPGGQHPDASKLTARLAKLDR
jgi:hypothetical protein